MTVFDDLAAEQGRLEGILGGLEETQWASPSGAAGWTVADVVVHRAQSEESVVITVSAGDLRAGLGSVQGGTVEEIMADRVRAERGPAPDVVFARWRRARRAALDALRAADPERPLPWVAAPVKPATLATTRLAEHWAHGLDITGPLRIEFPDTDRLRHDVRPMARSMIGELSTPVPSVSSRAPHAADHPPCTRLDEAHLRGECEYAPAVRHPPNRNAEHFRQIMHIPEMTSARRMFAGRTSPGRTGA